MIEIGDHSFYYSSLELKSVYIISQWQIDMRSLNALRFGSSVFHNCTRAVFESDWLWCEWMNRLTWIDFHSNGRWFILWNSIIGVEEYSHSQWVMTSHAFSEITRVWSEGILWLFSCRVWEWFSITVSDWIDLPELTSIQMGENAFYFKDDIESSTLAMRSNSHWVNWLIRPPQTHFTHNYQWSWVEFDIPLSSSYHS